VDKWHLWDRFASNENQALEKAQFEDSNFLAKFIVVRTKIAEVCRRCAKLLKLPFYASLWHKKCTLF
jgi:hypothetical protein